jgi:hypothetical protein
MSDQDALAFDVLEDKRCQNYIGSYSCLENLSLIRDKKAVFPNRLMKKDRRILFQDMEGILSDTFMDKIWEMIFKRYQQYEKI